MRNHSHPWFRREPRQWINPQLIADLDRAIAASRAAAIFGVKPKGPTVEEILQENARKVYFGE